MKIQRSKQEMSYQLAQPKECSMKVQQHPHHSTNPTQSSSKTPGQNLNQVAKLYRQSRDVYFTSAMTRIHHYSQLIGDRHTIRRSKPNDADVFVRGLTLGGSTLLSKAGDPERPPMARAYYRAAGTIVTPLALLTNSVTLGIPALLGKCAIDAYHNTDQYQNKKHRHVIRRLIRSGINDLERSSRRQESISEPEWHQFQKTLDLLESEKVKTLGLRQPTQKLRGMEPHLANLVPKDDECKLEATLNQCEALKGHDMNFQALMTIYDVSVDQELRALQHQNQGAEVCQKVENIRQELLGQIKEEEFHCPILLDIPEVPIKTNHNRHYYDRDSLIEWGKDPISRQPLHQNATSPAPEFSRAWNAFKQFKKGQGS